MDFDIGTRSGPRRSSRMRAVLAAGTVAAIAVTGGTLVIASSASAAATTLKAAAEADGRYFGSSVGQEDLNVSGETNIAGTQFDMATPENEMKWDTIEPSNGTFNFSPGDAIVSFATSHGDRIRGHNLVWHSQLPGWVTSLPTSQVKAAMEAHITGEVSHYKGKIYAWDVVNEPFNDDGSCGSDVFLTAFGSCEAYIADAITTAHAADPAAKLYVNDFNIEGENSKSNAMFTLAQQLLAAGVPLGGIGLESHFIVGQNPTNILANMQRFTALGIDVAVTELDDRMPTPASSANLAQQATDDANTVKDCLAVSRCVGITQWNISDADSWVPGTFSGMGAATLFDTNFQPKPSFTSVLAALNGGSSSPPPSSPPPSSPPPSSPPPSSPPPSSPPPGTSTCHVTDAINAWNTGLTSNLTVTNTGTTAINGWSLKFTLASGQVIVQTWNASITPTSGAVTATNLSYNAGIAPGGNVTLGFNANHTGNPAAPASFTLNGVACSVG
jgi:endo-1,4-beta-xylanase